jgi:hypothetical protein
VALLPGINGPTSKAGLKNADNNLKQIWDWIQGDPELAVNTDEKIRRRLRRLDKRLLTVASQLQRIQTEQK